MQGRTLNESLEDIVVEWVEKKVGPPSEGKIVALSGMAFKGQPETSDLRGSSAVNIARKLSALGYRLHLHDFVAPVDDLRALALGSAFEKLHAAVHGASLLLILNNHKKYASLQEDEGFLTELSNLTILDAWGVCSGWNRGTNASVFTLGNLMI